MRGRIYTFTRFRPPFLFLPISLGWRYGRWRETHEIFPSPASSILGVTGFTVRVGGIVLGFVSLDVVCESHFDGVLPCQPRPWWG
jgi:hypothetical protein